MNVISVKYSKDKRLMRAKSDNKEILIGFDTNEIIEELFASAFT